MTDARTDFVTDYEIAERWRVDKKTAGIAILAFEKNPRFPQPDPMFGGKRYWRAVVAFMDARAGISLSAPEPPDGEEHLGSTSNNRRRTRPQLATTR